MADLFTAADVSGISDSAKALLVVGIGIVVLFTATKVIKKVMNRGF
jgi:hypothetical protein